MFSNWGLHYPTRTLFDVGPGCSCMLDKGAFAAERVVLSHGHQDHLGDLPAFVGARSSMKGANDKPLTIYAPESRNMKAYRDLIFALYPRLKFPLTFETVHAGVIIPVTDRLRLEAFDVQHTFGSLGWKVMERRQRLKKDINPSDVVTLRAQGVDIHESYEANVFTWLLDSSSFDRIHIQNAAWVIGDSTFLRQEDREDPTHSTCEEIMTWCRDANVKRLSLAHWSTRYPWAEIQRGVSEIQKRTAYQGQIDVVLPDRVWEL